MANNFNPYQNLYSYNPVYQTPVSQNPYNQIFVVGIEGAKAYPLPNGVTATLWDSEKNLFYIKQVDAVGRPSIVKICEYNDYVEPTSQQQMNSNYATKEDLSRYLTKEDLDKALSELSVGEKGRVVRNEFNT
jgi:hypothetical protein